MNCRGGLPFSSCIPGSPPYWKHTLCYKETASLYRGAKKNLCDLAGSRATGGQALTRSKKLLANGRHAIWLGVHSSDMHWDHELPFNSFYSEHRQQKGSRLSTGWPLDLDERHANALKRSSDVPTRGRVACDVDMQIISAKVTCAVLQTISNDGFYYLDYIYL